MPNTSAVLDAARALGHQRLAELDEERKRLERALAELGGKTTARSPGRPRGHKSSATVSKASSAATPGPRKRKRRKRRGGTRADQTMKLIEKSPGITGSEAAKEMKIRANYLYRVLGELEKEGRVKKKGRQYYPSS
jgi:sugar-specific transcriptional regulator TrmB